MDPNKRISEIMSINLICVRPDEKAATIREIFVKHDFHHLPVTNTDGILVGMISQVDFHRISYNLSQQTTGPTWTTKAYDSMEAQDFMTTQPLSIRPDDSVGLAADIFLANKFHALPVIQGKELVGLVTTHDLLAYSFKSPIESTIN
ncbi:MAG: CBS domain-containing protein [Saprospiraceae bacterium]|nr:CBS domain-containing protein [Saprospiraceae bacterium]